MIYSIIFINLIYINHQKLFHIFVVHLFDTEIKISEDFCNYGFQVIILSAGH